MNRGGLKENGFFFFWMVKESIDVPGVMNCDNKTC